MGKLRSVQVLRCVAALAVVFCHAVDLPVGAAGVDLFFVISGFIMATVAPGRTPAEFLTARLRRIYPIYWIALLPWLAIASALGFLTLPKLVASLTLWPVYDQFYRPALPAGWSLCFEMLFYLAVAVALAWGARWVICAYLAALVLSFAFPSPLFDFLGNLITLEFLAGVAIARFTPRLNALWLVPALLILAASPDLSQIVVGQDPPRLFWWGLPAVLIFGVARSHESLFRRREFDFPVFLGDASYSIYLCHQLVLFLPLIWPAGVAFAVLVGCALHLGVERRFSQLPIWRSRRQKGPSTDDTAPETVGEVLLTLSKPTPPIRDS